MKKMLWLVMPAVCFLPSCNWDEGACWSRAEEDGQVGAGGGPIGPGWGGYGDAPDPKPLGAGDTRPPSCVTMGSFSSSDFVFKTTQLDDGVGYGWQEATPTLRFSDGRQSPTQSWTCSISVGMPLRTSKLGKISADWAATTSADIATTVASPVMHSQPVWVPAAFCKAFKDAMNALFKADHETLGARVEVIGSGS